MPRACVGGWAIVTLVILFASADVRLARSEEPYASYALGLIQREIPTAGDYWEGAGGGGYLFRFFFDVDGDGVDEVFLTSSLDTFQGRSEWRAFRHAGEGSFVEYPETLRFCLSGFSSQQTPVRTTIIHYFSNRHDGEWDKFTFLRYDFENGTLTARTGIVRQEEIDALDEVLSFRESNLEAISLRDFVEDEHRAWRRVNRERWNDSSDWVRLLDYDLPGEDFTPQRAFDILLAGGRKNFLLMGGDPGMSRSQAVARPRRVPPTAEVGHTLAPLATALPSAKFGAAGLLGIVLALAAWRWLGRFRFEG